MGILRHIFIATLALCATACYDDFTPDIETESVLCINSLITAGEPIEVRVSRTWLYSDTAKSNRSVPDASVTVYVNGTTAGEDYIAREGDSIRIVAESAVYGRAEAATKVPVAVPIVDVSFSLSDISIWKDFSNPRFMYADVHFDINAEMTLSDQAGADNFYRFSYTSFAKEYSTFYPGYFEYDAEPIFSEHEGVFESVMGYDSSGSTFFTDRQFAGDKYTLHLRFTYGGWRSQWSEEDEYADMNFDCGLEFTLSSISESYYNWLCYMWHTENGILGDISEIGLGAPLRGYSNVSTGAGVVAARTDTNYTLNLKEALKQALELND